MVDTMVEKTVATEVLMTGEGLAEELALLDTTMELAVDDVVAAELTEALTEELVVLETTAEVLVVVLSVEDLELEDSTFVLSEDVVADVTTEELATVVVATEDTDVDDVVLELVVFSAVDVVCAVVEATAEVEVVVTLDEAAVVALVWDVEVVEWWTVLEAVLQSKPTLWTPMEQLLFPLPFPEDWLG